MTQPLTDPRLPTVAESARQRRAKAFPRLSGLVLAGVMAAQAAPAFSQPAGQTISIQPSGPMGTLYSWSQQRCEDEFLPDSPVRAFRRADGQIVMMASHRENWSLIGPNFSSLRPSCRSVLRSTQVRQTEGTGFLWIQGLYTRDGKSVSALVSEDRSQITKQSGCDPKGVAGGCWHNNILAARSEDMGQSFNLLDPGQRSVASLAPRYPANARNRFGAFTVSNIVQKDGAYYMMAWVQGEGMQRPGNCLFRTDDPMKPETWRGWNGKDFTVDMRSGEAPNACQPIGNLPSEVRSLTYSTKHKTWIAVFASRQTMPGDTKPVPGFYYTQSPDLIHWQGGLKRIMTAATKARENQNDYIMWYPSLIDPNSRSRNFDTIDSDQPYLTFTMHYLANGRGTKNRDIKYVPVSLE